MSDVLQDINEVRRARRAARQRQSCPNRTFCDGRHGHAGGCASIYASSRSLKSQIEWSTPYDHAQTTRTRLPKEVRELTADELEYVSGGSGKIIHSDFVVVKVLDTWTPKLF